MIVLILRNSEEEKVLTLDAGADDCMVKPFSVQELLARVRALLRRAGSTEDPQTFESRDLKIDFDRRVVSVRGARIRLTPKEFELLRFLVANKGKALRHRRLLQTIWGPNYGDERQYLRVFISQLRKKIEPNPSQPVGRVQIRNTFDAMIAGEETSWKARLMRAARRRKRGTRGFRQPKVTSPWPGSVK
jgi:two-component system KDP operon response regulator KdpE